MTQYAMYRGSDFTKPASLAYVFNTREECVKFWTGYGFIIQPEDTKFWADRLWYVREVIA